MRDRSQCVGVGPRQGPRGPGDATEQVSYIQIYNSSCHTAADSGSAAPPIASDRSGGATTWAEVDPAASALRVTVVSSGVIVTALGDGRPPACNAVTAGAGAAPVATESGAVALRDDFTAVVDPVPGAFERARPRHRAKGQAAQRRTERELRMRAVAFRRAARASGFSAREAAEVLDLSPRTLSHWCHRLATDGLEERAAREAAAGCTGGALRDGDELPHGPRTESQPGDSEGGVPRRDARRTGVLAGGFLCPVARRTRWSVAN